MLKDIWTDILATLEKSLNPGLFSIWIKPLAARYEDGVLNLYAPNDFVASWVRDRLMGLVADAALQTMGSSPEVQVLVDPTMVAPVPAATKQQTLASRQQVHAQIPVPTQVGLPIVQPPKACREYRWRFSFEDFVVGPSNELALAASKGMCHDTLASDHLFLSARPGLGKTHLLHSIGRRLSATSNRSNPRIACLSSEEFATRFVLAMRANELTRFKAEFRDAADVLLLEDVHFFPG